MPALVPDRLLGSYRARLAAVHAEIARQIAELYGDVDPDAIEASVRSFIVEAAPVIEAGQQSTSAIAAAFIRSYTLARTGRVVDVEDEDEPIAGVRRDGTPIAAGMAAFGPMILGRIRDGATLEDAIAFGLYLATRYADDELTSAVDRTIERQTTGRFTTWEGIVNPGACDPCLENAGIHPIDVEIYRHPSCKCTYVPLIDVAS